VVSEQTMQFLDEGVQQQVSVPLKSDSVMGIGSMNDILLGSWLERPLEIGNFNWDTGGGMTFLFDPWTLFMEDPRNINKIAYFNNFQCDALCLKFLINGGPFLYGRAMASYLPFDGVSASAVSDNMSFFAGLAPSQPEVLVAASHRPHVLLDPTLSQGGCFELPFLWHRNWIEIPKAEWKSLGRVSLQSFGSLASAGGVGLVSIKIKVFAWMKNPRLAVPTSALPTLPAQSTAGDDDYGMRGTPIMGGGGGAKSGGDEYVGMVSKPATAIANLAGKLKDFPIIGTYARATEIAAGGAAGLAKMAGFSRPNILEPIAPIRPTFVNDLATTDKPEYVIKITTDSKQELSISPASFGADTGDCFSISGLVGRETYLGSFVWGTGVAESTLLFNSLVTPMLFETFKPAGFTVNKQFILTAMAYGALPFRYWKGNIKYRFQLVASQFHRGRIKVVYDFAAQPLATKSNSVYSRIIDIQESTEFTVTVGWNNPTPMAELHSTNPIQFSKNWTSNSIALTPDVDYHNGSLSVFVENELIVPIPGVSADASWLVWVSMENPVFNEPGYALQQITPSLPFVATAGEEGEPTASMTIGDIGLDPNLNQVVFGETIPSYRTLLRRYCSYTMMTCSGLSATIASYLNAVFRDFPLFPGSDSNGINVTSTAVKTNFVGMTLGNYLAMSHSCYRGGQRYKFQLVSNGTRNSQNLEYIRYPSVAGSTPLTGTTLYTTAVPDGYASTANKLGSAWLGNAVTDAGVQPFLEVEAPFWVKNRFLNPKYYSNNSKQGNATQVVMNPVQGSTTYVLKVWTAPAEDFQLGMYTGPPALWLSAYNTYI
jgi:hypothetical protein